MLKPLTLDDLNPHKHPLTAKQKANQEKLLSVLNWIQEKRGVRLVVTCGVRSWEEHSRIYASKGRKPPKASKHLIVTGDGKEGDASAVDLWDQDKSLWRFCMDHAHELQQKGVHLEDGNSTVNWLHVQVTPPASGNFVFVPFAATVRRG